MAKKELIPAKQEKARERLKNFRAELSDYQQTFQRLKSSHEDSVPLPSPPLKTLVTEANGAHRCSAPIHYSKDIVA